MNGRYLLLEKKIRDLKMYLGVMLRNYPRYEKFAIAHEIRSNITMMQRMVIATGKKYFKKTDLRDLDIEHEMLRQNILISYEMKYIDMRRFEYVSGLIDEVGRLIGDWISKL
ncbi:MAG: diversity-generating retroelement protein bAvd family protein [Candidatus Paceibacterota bacterium]